MKLTPPTSLVLFGLMILIVFGCKNDPNEPSEQSSESTKEEIRITKKDIDGLNYVDYVLSPQVKTIVVDWNGYQQVASSVSFLKTADLTFFKSEIDVIKSTMDDLRTGVPSALDTKAILSRLTVVETKFLKLQNDLTLDNIAKDTQLESIREVFVAWSNLTFTMNKKLEFESNDAERPEGLSNN